MQIPQSGHRNPEISDEQHIHLYCARFYPPSSSADGFACFAYHSGEDLRCATAPSRGCLDRWPSPRGDRSRTYMTGYAASSAVSPIPLTKCTLVDHSVPTALLKGTWTKLPYPVTSRSTSPESLAGLLTNPSLEPAWNPTLSRCGMRKWLLMANIWRPVGQMLIMPRGFRLS